MRAESLRGYPLEAVAQALGYRRDPDDAARWRRPGSALSINRFMFYDHLCAEGGAGAIQLAGHALGCTPRAAIDFLTELSDLSLCCLAHYLSARFLDYFERRRSGFPGLSGRFV